MPKTKISEYSTTNSSNTDIEGINIDEGCAPSGINNAIRELMVHLKEFQTGASGDAFTFAGGVLISGTANTITGNVLMSGTNTITGSTTATFAAGAVGTPSIAAHGDTNTGIFFPAADTIAFAEGGAEAMRLDASGNLGLGVTPSAWGSNARVVQMAGSGSVFGQTNANIVTLGGNMYWDNTNFKYIATDFASRYAQYQGEHILYSASSGTAGNNITFTQVLAVNKDKSLALQGATSQSGAGITFPATQSASSNANTLDDYEEGDWTPTVTFGGGSTGITYNTRVGSYTKVGRIVTVQCYVYLSSKGSSTGVAEITGLPFTSSSTTGLVFGGSIGGYTFMASLTFPIAQVAENSTKILLRNGGATTDPQMTEANFNNGLILVTLTYFT